VNTLPDGLFVSGSQTDGNLTVEREQKKE